jgi:SAM-dependent methyltransferase
MRCRRCALTFAGRSPSDGELQAYYEDYGHAWFDSPITRDRYDELLDSFEPYRRHNRLLDMGCGAGFFLEQARARGWDAFGSEYGERALKLARGKGLHVVKAPVSAETFPPRHFDVVTAFEVFEHLRDPVREAAVVARALRADGLLYCTTPNFDSLTRRMLGPRWNVIDYPEHLWYFTPRTLRGWLEPQGFVVEKVTTSGISPSQFLRSLRVQNGHVGCPDPGDEGLRSAIERSPLLRIAKAAVNGCLSALNAGDTLKGRFRLAAHQGAETT